MPQILQFRKAELEPPTLAYTWTAGRLRKVFEIHLFLVYRFSDGEGGGGRWGCLAAQFTPPGSTPCINNYQEIGFLHSSSTKGNDLSNDTQTRLIKSTSEDRMSFLIQMLKISVIHNFATVKPKTLKLKCKMIHLAALVYVVSLISLKTWPNKKLPDGHICIFQCMKYIFSC